MKLNIQNAALEITAGRAEQFPKKLLPQIALSGRSNVGKSSLINVILNRKSLARVSATPGKTTTINFYNIDGKLYLVDLPGYGYAKRKLEEKKKWSALTDGYFTNNSRIDKLKLVVQLIDSRIGPTDDDIIMLEYLSECEIPFIIAATKSDKLNKTERDKFFELMKSVPLSEKAQSVILFSAKNGEGKEQLMNIINSQI